MDRRSTQRRAFSLPLVAMLLASIAPPARGTDPHSWTRIVDEYRTASRQGDLKTLRRLQADDARIWFAKKEGPGSKLDPGGKGPWADWDRFFNSRSETLEVSVIRDADRAVRITALETNDWFRLVDRTPVPYYIFYYIDDDDRIAGKLIQNIDGVEREPDRLDAFKAWAAQRYPGLVDKLLPEGKINPSLDRAKLWKRRLTEWRAEAGLPAIEP